jgi:hypothetical protein
MEEMSRETFKVVREREEKRVASTTTGEVEM